MKNNSASKYLDNPPIQWGLRGDPLLWEEMRIKMETINVPVTVNELEKMLYKQFKELTGENAKTRKKYFYSTI